jgi:hypothetical protein
MTGLEDTLAERLGWDPAGRVRFTCGACGLFHSAPAAEVIWMLKSLGLGDERSLIAEAAQLAVRPCVRCGATCWRASAPWPPG